MPNNTPPKRSTRATTQATPTLSDIEHLIISMKKELLSHFEEKMTKLENSLELVSRQVTNIEDQLTSLKKKTTNHDREIKDVRETVEHLKNELPALLADETFMRSQSKALGQSLKEKHTIRTKYQKSCMT